METQAARVLAECAASPDDDAPRLVWADLVGGERGELVVVQCDLARGDLSPREAGVRRRRERELLARHETAWAGSIATFAKRWSFRRGFVECAKLDLDGFDPKRLDAHPLLRSLAVENWDLPEHVPTLLDVVGRLRGLRLEPMPFYPRHDPAVRDRASAAATLGHLASDERARGLRAFAVPAAGHHDFAVLRTIVSRAPIEQLWLGRHRLGTDQLAALMAAAPRLSALELDADHDSALGIESVARRPLRALRVTGATGTDYEQLRASAACASLSHLAISHRDDEPQLRTLLGAVRLHTLELAGADLERVVAGVRSSETLADLRVLRIRGKISRATLERLIAERGPQLEVLEVRGDEIADDLRARVAGDVVVTTTDPYVPSRDDELLHESPMAMLALEHASFAEAAPVFVARLDQPAPVREVPTHPVDQRVLLGRATSAPIRLQSGTVARHHAAMYWRHGHYEIHDLGGTNGILVDGERIEQVVVTDGLELRFGDVVIQLFIGPGARERAEAAGQG